MFNIFFQKQTKWWGKKRKEKVVKCLGWWLDSSGKLVNTERLAEQRPQKSAAAAEKKLSLGIQNLNLFEGT